MKYSHSSRSRSLSLLTLPLFLAMLSAGGFWYYHDQLAQSSPCPPDKTYVTRVMGGWKLTSPSDPVGLCISNEELKDNIVNNPSWTDRVLSLLRQGFWGQSFLIQEAEAAGNTYYVATTGNDSRTCAQAQTITTPRRTITKGAECLAPGDTLLVWGGTYPATKIRQVQGSASAWITIKAYPGERPVIDAAVIEFPNAGRGIAIRESHYLIVEGFEVTSSNPDRIRLGNHAIDITNPADQALLKRDDVGNDDGNGIHLNTAHHIIVRGNEVHHVGTAFVSNQAFEDGSGDYFHDNQWLGNYVHHVTGYGTYICGDRITIRGNRFYSTSLQGIRIGCVGGKPSTNFIVENNLIHDNYPYLWHNSNRFISGGNGIVLCCTTPNGVTIRNNIIYNWKGIGIWASGLNILTANNTIYHTQTGPKLSDDGSSFVGTYSNEGILADFSSGVRLINNILYQTGGIVAVAGVVQSNNLLTNPLFVNPTAHDFHLQATSPAIDAGTSLPEVPCDFDGNGRPTGSAYDIGAYEYGGSPGSGCNPGPSPGPSPSPSPTPIFTFTAWPTSVATGGTSQLSWSSPASSCTASGGWSGTKSNEGSQLVTPTVTTTYTLACGSETKSVTVTVGSSGYCNLYTSSSSIPAGYGVPWDVFHAQKPLLMTIYCEEGGAATLTLNPTPNPEYPYRYTYENAYYAAEEASSWTKLSLLGANKSGIWFPSKATAVFSPAQDTTTYTIGYICTWTGSQWKCGCRDRTCSQSYWQLQGVKR